MLLDIFKLTHFCIAQIWHNFTGDFGSVQHLGALGVTQAKHFIISFWEEVSSKHLDINTYINQVTEYKSMNSKINCKANE